VSREDQSIRSSWMDVLDFRYIASFRKQSAVLENRGEIFDLPPL